MGGEKERCELSKLSCSDGPLRLRLLRLMRDTGQDGQRFKKLEGVKDQFDRQEMKGKK